MRKLRLFNSVKDNKNVENIQPIIKDLDAFCTLALTPKYSKEKSQMIESFSFAIHLDFVKSLDCCISKDILGYLCSTIIEITDALSKSKFNLIYGSLKAEEFRSKSTRSEKINTTGEFSFGSTSNSLSSLSIVDESQLFDFKSSNSSRLSPFKLIRIKNEQTKVNFWIQTTIMKANISINDKQDMLVISMEDITTFFDINSSYKKVSLKLGSFEIYHNIFNIKSEC